MLADLKTCRPPTKAAGSGASPAKRETQKTPQPPSTRGKTQTTEKRKIAEPRVSSRSKPIKKKLKLKQIVSLGNKYKKDYEDVLVRIS